MSSSSSDVDSVSRKRHRHQKTENGNDTSGATNSKAASLQNSSNDSENENQDKKDGDTEYYDYFASSDFEYEYEYEYDYEPAHGKDSDKRKANSGQKRQSALKQLLAPILEHEEEEEIEDEIEKILGEFGAFYQDKDVRTERLKNRYLVKFKEESYSDAKWMNLSDIRKEKGGQEALKVYQNETSRCRPNISLNHPELICVNEVDSSFYVDERIINDSVTDEEVEYQVKWRGLPHSSASWVKKKDLYHQEAEDHYNARLKRPNPRKVSSRWEHPKPKDFVAIRGEKRSKDGLKFTKEQNEIANFITENYFKDQNTIIFSKNPLISIPILAVALEQISLTTKQAGPYLILADDIDCYLWKDALDNWTSLDSFIYYFDKGAKEIITSLEFSAVDDKGSDIPDAVQFDVIIASFKDLKRLQSHAGEIQWRFTLIDCTNEPKHAPSFIEKRIQAISTINFAVLSRCEFDVSTLPQLFKGGAEKCTKSIDSPLDPLITPCKNIMVGLSQEQRAVIQDTLLKSNKALGSIVASIEPPQDVASTVMGTITNVRAAFSHPYLVDGARAKIDISNPNEVMQLSGKFAFIKKLLKEREGKRVLLFSQFPGVCELLQSLLKKIGYKSTLATSFQRYDVLEKNSTKGNIVLFSSRAGGRRINMENFDTIVVIDDDTYRIKVSEDKEVYRLVTPETFEEFMLKPEFSYKSFDDSSIYTGRVSQEQLTVNVMEKLLQMSTLSILSSDQEAYDKFLGLSLDEMIQRTIDPNNEMPTHTMPLDFWSGIQASLSHVDRNDVSQIDSSIHHITEFGVRANNAIDLQVVRLAMGLEQAIGISENIKAFIKKGPKSPLPDEAVQKTIGASRAIKIVKRAVLADRVKCTMFKVSKFPDIWPKNIPVSKYTLLRNVILDGISSVKDSAKVMKLAKAIIPSKKIVDDVPENFIPPPLSEMPFADRVTEEKEEEEDTSESSSSDDNDEEPVVVNDDASKQELTIDISKLNSGITNALIAHGVPITKDGAKDWELLGKYSRVDGVTAEAAQKTAEELLKKAADFVEKNEKSDLSEEDANLIYNSNQLFKKLYTFNEEDYKFNSPTGAPEWWTSKHSCALLKGIKQYGTRCIFRILCNNGYPFHKQISSSQIEEFKKAADDEREQKETSAELGELVFLSTPFSRINAAEQIMNSAQKEEKQGGQQSSFTLISPGEHEEGEQFKSKYCPFNPGYKAKRMFEGKEYTCSIEKKEDKPVFKVEDSENQQFEGSTPTEAWKLATKTDAKISGIWLFGIVRKDVLEKLGSGDKYTPVSSNENEEHFIPFDDEQ